MKTPMDILPARFRLEEELFEIPHRGDSLVYAPLRKAVVYGGKGLVNLLVDLQEGRPVDGAVHGRTLRRLRRLGILDDDRSPRRSRQEKNKDYRQPFQPTTLTLFLTSDCNLGCPYCYGDGGDRAAAMPVELGLEAIDLLFLNAARAGAKQVQLGFHGGGEPMLKKARLVRLTDHAQMLAERRRIGLQTGLSTNGVMPPRAAAWVADRIDHLNVSFDGPPEVQNRQRPLKSGAPSYHRVKATLDYWDDRHKAYGIRSTVTRESQARIPEMVVHVQERFRPRSIHLEPMFPSARAMRHRWEAPEPEPFVEGFLRAAKILESGGIPLHFSGSSFPELKKAFCGIGWRNFAVTPAGEVTSCFEVLSGADGRADRFIYGRHVAGKGFVLDPEKIEALRRLSDTEPDECRNCFAKYHCAGDCRAKAAVRSGREDGRVPGRCEIIRGIIKGRLLEQLGLPTQGEGS